MAAFIDFDGVICDSILECHASAYLQAYGELPRGAGGALLEFQRSQRPFVSHSEDYAVILEMAARGFAARDFAGFSAFKSSLGEGRVAALREDFIAARSRFLAEEEELWYALNPIYPFLLPRLGEILGRDDSYVLSTKSANFIFGILRRNGIEPAADRILSVYGETKLSAALGVMEKNGIEMAVLVDDQVEHLVSCAGTALRPLLASWGYCGEGPYPVETIDPAGFLALFGN